MNIDTLLQEIEELKQELKEVKEQLKKYTAPKRNIAYYHNHREEILKKIKEDPSYKEKNREKSKKAYLKRKEQKLLEKENKDI